MEKETIQFEDLIDFETALLSRKLGFEGSDVYDRRGTKICYSVSEKILKSYFSIKTLSDVLQLSTKSDLQKWLREKHNVIVYVKPYRDIGDDVNEPLRFKWYTTSGDYCKKEYKTWEEALADGLKTELLRLN